ncbi:MAG: hypothetical protein EZS28_055343, partial [Streblomastix strix]
MPQPTPPQFDPQSWKLALIRIGQLNPQLIYLTHYGVIEFKQEMVQDVSQKLDKYVEIVDEALQMDDKDKKDGEENIPINDSYFKEK